MKQRYDSCKNHPPYDYSMYPDEGWPDEMRRKTFWGLHKIEGRIEVDVKRYLAANKQLGANEFVPKEFTEPGFPAYFTPREINRYDYFCNYMDDCLKVFLEDWNNEYRPLFDQIMTPAQAEERSFSAGIPFMGCSDDYDDVVMDSRIAGLRRSQKYWYILNELHCMFISKLCTVTDRAFLSALMGKGYDFDEFGMKSLRIFSTRKNKRKRLEELDCFDTFNSLHMINNFIKHNSLKSYNNLRKAYPQFISECDDAEYENGMYAGDWLVLKDTKIEDLIEDLRAFCRSYAENILMENVEDADWNYDGYFIMAYNNMKDPMEYNGLYFGSPFS